MGERKEEMGERERVMEERGKKGGREGRERGETERGGSECWGHDNTPSRQMGEKKTMTFYSLLSRN